MRSDPWLTIALALYIANCIGWLIYLFTINPF